MREQLLKAKSINITNEIVKKVPILAVEKSEDNFADNKDPAGFSTNEEGWKVWENLYGKLRNTLADK